MGTGIFGGSAGAAVFRFYDNPRGLANSGEDAFYPIYRESFGLADRPRRPCSDISNSRLVENRSDTVGKEQLASLAFRSDSMLAVDGCSLVFLEGRVFN